MERSKESKRKIDTPDSTANSEKPDLDFLTVMEIMELANKRIQADAATSDAVEHHFDIEKQRTEIKDILKKSYEDSGTKVTEEQLDRAIDDYVSSMFEFSEPKNTFGYKFATLYTERSRLARRYGPPVAGIAASIAIITGLSFAGVKANYKYQEAKIERSAESVYSDARSIEKRIKDLASAELDADESAQIKAMLIEANKSLQKAKPFVDKFCPE